MEKFNDRKLYFYSILITLGLGVILFLLFAYSRFSVESGIIKLLNSEENISENYANAFKRLKSPQIFARYNNFDENDASIETFIKVYDDKLKENKEFTSNDKVYLQKILDRRVQGSTLTRNTMIFFLLLTVIGIIFYLIEIKRRKN